MKKFIYAFMMLILTFGMLSINVEAQTTQKSNEAKVYEAKDYYPLGVGLSFAFKGSVNTMDSPKGVKNDYIFASMPDISAQVYIPFQTDNNMGVLIDFAYLGFAYKFKLYADEDVNWVDKVKYFSIAPNFHISGFMVGMNFGFPLSAESDNDITGNDFTYSYDKDNMGMLVDIHIGALIPLIKSNFGRLNLFVQAEYALNKLFQDDLTTQSDVNSSEMQSFNIQPAGLKFGLSYILNTGLMQR